MENQAIVQLIVDSLYLLAIVFFIVGLKKLSAPDTARKGNLLAATGMGMGVLVALFSPLDKNEIGLDINLFWVFIALTIGAVIGILVSKKIKMTDIPEMVSLFNGLGGAATFLVAFLELKRFQDTSETGAILVSLMALFIGGISFTGSLVAYGKLSGKFKDAIKIPKAQFLNLIQLIAIVVLAILFLTDSQTNNLYIYIFLGISLFYGLTFVIPIGGGDMPVVISLLNSFTGIGATLAGIIYDNNLMLFGGILVGASGTILTVMMCKAMNRSLFNVLLGGFGSSSGASAGDKGNKSEGNVQESTVVDVAILMKYATKVVIVPGYGMAVAQAQHTVHELEKKLQNEGVEVKYAIHPVAGRMPGHMNVLLAEADVSYNNLMELEDANSTFPTTDIVIVIGANDVVNPDAKLNESSPIFGMPILEVEYAKQIIVMKRSMNKGYAGIQNPLFFGEKTKMLFGDGKSTTQKIIAELDNV